jgi:hypothetical protein
VRVEAPVTLEDARALRRGLETNATLERLVLDRAKVESRDALLEMAAGIGSAASRSLRELGFTSYNGLGRVGPKLAWDREWGALVAQLLGRRDCKLERCDLRHNRMGPAAGRLIRDALVANTALVDLRCSGNAFEEDDSCAIHNLVSLSRFVAGWAARGAALPDWVRKAIPDQAELLVLAFAGEVECLTESVAAAAAAAAAAPAAPGGPASRAAAARAESDSEVEAHDESDESGEDEADDSERDRQGPRLGFLRDAQLKLRVLLATPLVPEALS